MRILLSFVFVFILSPALALAEASETPITVGPLSFQPDAWAPGVHMLAGLGLNGAIYNSRDSHRTLGLGLNFKTDIGYYLNDRFAVEVGSFIKFNRSDNYLFWDSLFTLGVRYRFRSFFTDSAARFVRVFVGDAPTVVYLGDENNPLRAIGATRAQIDGPVVGMGGGSFWRTSDGTNLFFEFDLTWQWLRFSDAIVDKNDVPIVLQSGETAGSPTIFAASLSIGILLF